MSGFALLFLRPLLHRPVRTVVAVLGVAGGAALAVAVLTVRESVTESVAGFHDAGSADLVVSATTPGGIDDGTVAGLATDADVDLAVPVVRRHIAIDGTPIPLVGVGDGALALGAEEVEQARDAALEVVSTDAETVAAGIVLGAPAAEELGVVLGGDVEVHGSDGVTRPTTVTAIVESSAIDASNGGQVAFAELAVARSLAGLGDHVDLVLVDVGGADVEQVRERLAGGHPTVQVDTPGAFVRRELGLFRTAENQLLPIAAVSLVIAAVLVFNSVNMTVLERRRQLANLRAVGASRRLLLSGIIGQSAVLGAIGGLLGAIGGLVIARPVVERMDPVLADIIGNDISFHVAPAAVPFAVVGAVLAGIGAGIVPARRVVSIEPTDALRPTGTPAEGGTAGRWLPRPTIIGVALVVLGLAGLVLGPIELATSATAGIALGGVVTTYGLAGPVATGAARVLRRIGGLPSIAAAGIARNPQRLWATATALAMGVALAIAIGGGIANQRTFTAGQFASLRATDLWVGAAPAESLTYGMRLPDDVPERIADLDGVQVIATDTLTHVTIEGHRVIAIGLEGASSFPLLDAADPAVRQQALAGEGAVISHEYAKTFDLAAGDAMNLPGSTELVVLEVVETLALAERGMFVVADDVLRSALPGLVGINSVEVHLEPGATAGAVGEQVDTLLSDRSHPLAVQTGDEAYEAVMAALDPLYAATDGMLLVVLLIGGLAVLNTVFASVLERRRELGVLRAIGSSPRQTLRIIVFEVATITVIGLGTGLMLGELLHWAGTTYAAAATPLPVDYLPAPAATFTALVAGTIAAAAGALIPIRTLRRLDVIDALAWE